MCSYLSVYSRNARGTVNILRSVSAHHGIIEDAYVSSFVPVKWFTMYNKQ